MDSMGDVVEIRPGVRVQPPVSSPERVGSGHWLMAILTGVAIAAFVGTGIYCILSPGDEAKFAGLCFIVGAAVLASLLQSVWPRSNRS